MSQINARVRHKRDTSANWTSQNPVLLSGELIVVDTDSGEVRFKIGDGVKTYTQLPFQDEVVRGLISENSNAIGTLEEAVGNKVEKVEGMGLSSNDYTIGEKEKLAGIAAGAEVNVTPDWNADEGEPGYVLNRTHYSEINEGELLPETNVTFSDGIGSLAEPAFNALVGSEYTVTWNGAEYKCVAQTLENAPAGFEMLNGMPALGNFVVFGGENTGEPFALVCVPEEQVAHIGFALAFTALDGSTSATVSISGESESVHPLDGKFLPEGTPYFEFVPVSFPETAGVYDSDLGCYAFEGRLDIVVGSTYTVTYNGVPYKCKCTIADLGNTETARSFFVEPVFILMVLNSPSNGYTIFVLPLDGADSVTLAIEGVSEIPHKLDKRLIPKNEVGTLFVTCKIVRETAYSETILSEISHTYEEVVSAFESGRDVVLCSTGNNFAYTYNLLSYDNPTLTFTRISFFITQNNITFMNIDVLYWSGGNSVKIYEKSQDLGLFSTSGEGKDGVVPGSDGSTTKFLRADGVWEVIPTADTSLGLVQSGGDINVSSGIMTINEDAELITVDDIDAICGNTIQVASSSEVVF